MQAFGTGQWYRDGARLGLPDDFRLRPYVLTGHMQADRRMPNVMPPKGVDTSSNSTKGGRKEWSPLSRQTYWKAAIAICHGRLDIDILFELQADRPAADIRALPRTPANASMRTRLSNNF